MCIRDSFRVFNKKHPAQELLKVTHRYDDGIRTSDSNQSFRRSGEAFLGYNKGRLHNLKLILPISQEDADYMAAWLEKYKALWPYAAQCRTHPALASISRRHRLEKTRREEEQKQDIRHVARAVERCFERKIHAALKVKRVRPWAVHRQEREVICLQRQREQSLRYLLD